MKSIGFETGEKYARELDLSDPLRKYRERFHTPRSMIYLDGNSLGLLSRDAHASILRVVNEWKTLGIRGWLEAQPPWFYLAENLGSTCAKLVGAKPDEVVATGTTTINIHSLVNTFYRPCGSRRGIIADELDFPSDIYALKSALELRGLDPDIDLILTPSKDGRFLEESEIVELMDERVALIFLPSVLYRSGQLLNMQYLVEEAHSRGIPIGFDCCHSVGIVEHHFDKLDLDFAVWCSYKYLNGGPGSTAFLYVNRKHFDQKPAIAGWFGCVKDKQFDMSLEFQHSKSAGGWQISSPAILSSAPIEGSLKMILEVGMEEIRRKSLKMTSYLTFLIDELLSQYPYNFSIGTPREDHRRGGHVAIEHKEAMRISAALRTRGIIPDHRRPNIIRVAPVPLYNTYSEVRQLIQSLKEIIEGEEYRGLSRNRKMIS